MSNIGRKVKIVKGQSADSPIYDTITLIGEIGEVIDENKNLITIQMKDGTKRKVWSPDCKNDVNECIWYNEPEYTIEAIKGKRIAVHCPTQEEYDLVCPILNGKENRLNGSEWKNYGEKTAVQQDQYGGSFGDIPFYEKNKWEIISAQTFLTANNIKTMTATEKKIKELEDQLNELKESLKAPQYKVGDWVYIKDGGCRIGPGMQGHKLTGNCYKISSDTRRGTKWGYTLEGTPAECDTISGSSSDGSDIGHFLRPATPEEIAAASKVKVTIGDAGKEVTIEKGKITAHDGNTISIKVIDNLVESMNGTRKAGMWKVECHKIDVGCVKNITLAQLQKVQEEYKHLNP